VTPERAHERDLERRVPLTREAILALEPAALAGDLDAAYLYVAGCQSAGMFDRVTAMKQTLGDRDLPPWLEAFLDLHEDGGHDAQVAHLRDLVARSSPDLVVPRARLGLRLAKGADAEKQEAVLLADQLLQEAPESVWGYFLKAYTTTQQGRLQTTIERRRLLDVLERLAVAEGPKGKVVQIMRTGIAAALHEREIVREAYTALRALEGRPAPKFRLWTLQRLGALAVASYAAAIVVGLARLPFAIPFTVIPYLVRVPAWHDVAGAIPKTLKRSIPRMCIFFWAVGLAAYLLSSAVMHGRPTGPSVKVNYQSPTVTHLPN